MFKLYLFTSAIFTLAKVDGLNTITDCEKTVLTQDTFQECSGVQFYEIPYFPYNNNDVCDAISKSKIFQCIPLLFINEKLEIDPSNKPSACRDDDEWNILMFTMENLKAEIPQIRDAFNTCENNNHGSTTSLLIGKYKLEIKNHATSETSAGIFLVCLLILYTIR